MWGYVDSINRIRRSTAKVVKVVRTWGNQKAISGGMGRVFPKKTLSSIDHQGKTINTNIAEVQAPNVFFGFLMILN